MNEFYLYGDLNYFDLKDRRNILYLIYYWNPKLKENKNQSV